MVKDCVWAARNCTVIAFFIDLFDILLMFVAPDCIKCKSIDDMVAALFKFLAFGAVSVGSTRFFLENFSEAGCMNPQGAALLEDLRTYYIHFCVLTVFSGIFSILEGPISAYDGHSMSRLKPYVKISF
jgi:hypothetical protein